MSDFGLNTYANGDTNYIAKMDADNGTIVAAVRNLQDQAAGATTGFASAAILLAQLFDDTPSLVGYDSYQCTGAGVILTVAPGVAWKPSTSSLVQLGASALIDFTGQPAGTYYIAIDAAGAPSRVSSTTEAFVSVVWTGTAFGAITRLAQCFMTAAEQQALLHSTALSLDFPTLLARLEHIEGLL